MPLSSIKLFTVTYSLRSLRSAPVGYAAEYLILFAHVHFSAHV